MGLATYGWPDWLDPLADEFASRFADFAAAAVRRIGPGGYYTPVNEISFLAWGGGEAGSFAPFRRDCASALKAVYCRAAILAARAIRSSDPTATSEPLIHVIVAHEASGSEEWARVATMRQAQHEAALTLLGAVRPELGGDRGLFDMIGLNYYPHNQFDTRRRMLLPGDPRRRPLHRTEGNQRTDWLKQICGEVRLANGREADVRAVCLYPILNHLGWDDDRYCEHGLFCGLDKRRRIHQPLADQIALEQRVALRADWAP